MAVGLADLADGGEEGAERVVQAADDVSVLAELQHQPVPRDQRPPHLRWGALLKGDMKGDIKGDIMGDIKGDMKGDMKGDRKGDVKDNKVT